MEDFKKVDPKKTDYLLGELKYFIYKWNLLFSS